MNYPYTDKQTIRQWILNTIDPRTWFRDKDCECSWHMYYGELLWIVLAGCPNHD